MEQISDVDSAMMDCSSDDDSIYPMTNNPHGYAIIIYMTDKDPKYGSKNQQLLKEMWERLDFKVIQIENPNKNELNNYIEQWKTEIDQNRSKNDCFSLSFIGHGGIKDGKEFLVLQNKEEYECMQLYAKFKANRFHGLAGKPKIFILQACRGYQDATLVEYTSASISSCVPDMSDLFVLQPSFFGYKNYFKIKDGESPFIEMVKEIFLNEYRVNDIQTMATKVANNLSKNSTLAKEGKCQATTTTSTLLKELYFSGTKGGSFPQYKAVVSSTSTDVKCQDLEKISSHYDHRDGSNSKVRGDFNQLLVHNDTFQLHGHSDKAHMMEWPVSSNSATMAHCEREEESSGLKTFGKFALGAAGVAATTWAVTSLYKDNKKEEEEKNHTKKSNE